MITISDSLCIVFYEFVRSNRQNQGKMYGMIYYWKDVQMNQVEVVSFLAL